MTLGRLGNAGGMVVLLLLTGCLCVQSRPAPTANLPAYNFQRFVYLEDAAENTANASIGDLDSDGDPDIVLAKGRHWPQRDLVLLNNGQGDFGERHALGTQEDRTYTAALADFQRYLELAPDGEHAAEATQSAADIQTQINALNN